jgi:N utilization substance protein B
MHNKPVPLSLRRKSSARLAAVQCAYRMRINEDGLIPEALFDDYMVQWHEDKSSPNRAMSFDAEPDKALFRKLLAGVAENSEHIESIIKTSLNDKWKMERMNPVLIAILACAIYELKYTPALNPAIIVNEYVTLTGRFFELQEIGFVNGLLDALSKTLR